MDIIYALLGGGAVAGIIELLRESLTWHRNRKAAKEDNVALNTDERLKTVENKVNALVESQKFMLYDRIRFLGQAYISEGEIDFDDRRILNDMHKSYHNGLGGNGDLDILMKEVNRLPLKTDKK